MSDGCLLKEGRNKTAYAVRICSNDFDIIEWLHKYMCVGNKIYKQGQNGYLIKYRNQEAITFMRGNNLRENKSLTMEFPNIPDEYVFDFIRGYFDGDGSIVIRETKHNTYSQISFTSGSACFLRSLQNKLKQFGIASHLYKDGRISNGSYYLRVTKRSEVEKLFQLMYRCLDGVGFLLRKYKKYRSFLEENKPKYQSHIA